jgi:predicted Zn-ribbon and HTH transcriptional regulator
MVTIATFNEPSQAKHLKSRLQEAGVKADVHNEGRLQKAAMMGTPQANAKVLVNEEDFEAANKFMLEWEASDPEVGTAIRCPQCKSPRVEYPQLTRKFMTPWLASVLFALKIFPKEFYCQDCHFTWGKDGDPLPRPAAWETFS